MARTSVITWVQEPLLASESVIRNFKKNISNNIEWGFIIFALGIDRVRMWRRQQKILIGLGANIVRDPEVRECAPRYYFVLFEDPDGIRLEVNFVPDTGLLENDANFVSGEEFIRVDREDLTA